MKKIAVIIISLLIFLSGCDSTSSKINGRNYSIDGDGNLLIPQNASISTVQSIFGEPQVRTACKNGYTYFEYFAYNGSDGNIDKNPTGKASLIFGKDTIIVAQGSKAKELCN